MVLSANGLGDGGDELWCRRGEANERDGGGRGAGAYSNAGVEGCEPLGVAVAADLPRPEEGGRVGEAPVGQWTNIMGPFQLNAAPLDLDAGPINLPFQLIKIRPAIEKSLP